MKKAIIKTLSVVLAVVLTFTAAPLSGFVGLELPEWLNFSLKAKATSVSSAEAIAWCESQLGKTLDYDGAYGGQCVDLIMYYYQYLGVSPVGGNACDYATNSLPSGWDRIEDGVPQPGDILVYTGGYGHVAICESENVAYHQNWGGQYVRKITRPYNEGYTYDGNTVTYWGCIRPDFSDSSSISGVCGDNLTWTLNENTGTLTISGTGEMYDYNSWDLPWEDYQYIIKKVIISNGVTTICDDVFIYCYNLTSLIIGDSLTSIGNFSFYGCTSLTSIIVDSNNQCYSSDEHGVLFNKDKTTLIQYPFGSERTSYTFPDSVTTISEGAFYSCDSLTNVTIGNSVTLIGDDAFSGCTKLISVTIPDSVTIIGDYSFFECASLTSVSIGESVTTIGDSAFYRCNKLTSVTIPDSVKTIGERAFSECSKLISVTIPDSVTSIGYGAFFDTAYYDDETNWENDVLYIDNHLIKAKYGIDGDYIVKEGTKTIADYAFSDVADAMNYLTSITIPESIIAIGFDAFGNSACLKSVFIKDLKSWCEIKFGNNPLNNSYLEPKLYLNGELVENLVIPDDVTTINSDAFRGYTSLKSATIGDNVSKIGSGMFADCQSLTNIYVSEDNQSYSSVDGVLYNKNKTEMIQYPAGKEETNYIFSDDITSIGNYAFDGCKHLTNIKIPDSVISIGCGAFYDCSSLTDVTLSDNLTSIEPSTFFRCYSLTDIIIPDNVTSIGCSAFAGCISLTCITIGKNVSYIGYDMYIGSDAFSGCNSLFEIHNNSDLLIEPAQYGYNHYHEIGVNAYVVYDKYGNATYREGYCDYIKTDDGFLFSKTIEGKYNLVGYNGNATELILPDSIENNPYKIFDYAFNNQFNLENIMIPNNITGIGVGAFYDTKIYNDEDNWENGVLYIGNHLIDTDYYLSGSCDVKNGTIVIADSAFCYSNSLTSVTIPDSVKILGEDAFMNSPITHIAIGSGLTTIGDGAFSSCDELISIEVSANNTNFSSKEGALFNKNKTTLIQYPIGNTRISYTIPDGVTTIGDSAFRHCNSLTSVIIPNSVSSILDYAFFGCYNLTDVHYSGTSKQWDNIAIYSTNYPLFYGTIHCRKEDEPKLYFNFSSNKDKIDIGDTVTLGAHYQRGNTTGISYDGDIRWESSNPNIIEVDKYYKNRVCVYLKAKKLGSSKITLYLDNEPVLSETVTVTVSDDTLFKDYREEIYNSSKFTILDNARNISKNIINGYSSSDKLLSSFFESVENFGNGMITNEILASLGLTQGKASQAEDKAAEKILMELIGIDNDIIEDAADKCDQIAEVAILNKDTAELLYEIANNTDFSYGDIRSLNDIIEDAVPLEEMGVSAVEIASTIALLTQFELEVIENLKHSTACGSSLYNALDRLYEKRMDLPTYAKERFLNETASNLLSGFISSLNGTTKIASVIFRYSKLFYDVSGGLDADDYMVAMNSWGFAGYLYNYSIKNTSSISKFETYYEYYVAAVKASLKTAIKISKSDYWTEKANNSYNEIVEKCHSDELLNQVVKEIYAEQALVKDVGGKLLVGLLKTSSKQSQSYSNYSVNEMNNFYNDANTENIINIPSHVDGNAISGIADNGYEGLTDIQGVVLPLTIETIGNYAFADSSSVEYVYLNEGVISIGDYAFANCSNLQDLILPDTLQTIGDSSFAGCNGIDSLDIGENVTSIGNKAFENCSGLSKVYFRNPNTVISSDAFDGCSDVTIYGYANSTAQTIAEQYGFNFVAFEESVFEMKVVTPATQKSVIQGGTVSTDGLTIEVTYVDGSKEVISSGWACAYNVTTPGEQQVIVHYMDGTVSYPITVIEKSIDEIVLSDSEITLFVTDSYKLTADADVNIALEDLVWSSADEAIVTVSDSGYITAVGTGSTTVTVYSSNGDVSASCIITVENKDEITATEECVRSKIISPTESGYYTFKLENNTDNVTALLCDLNNDVLATKSGINFEMTVWLVEGESYYFEFHTSGNNNSFTFEVLLPDEQDVPDDPECSHATTEVINYVAPTCTASGYAGDVKCLECGDIIESLGDISSAGHNYSSTITPPTCTTSGYTTYNCSACGDSYIADEISATGHSYSEGNCTVCGTKDPSYTEEPEYNYTFSIQTPSRTEIRNKDGIILHTMVEGNAPAGSYVRWESSNNNFDKDANGSNLEIIAKNKGWTTFTAILCDADGNELARDTVDMYSKSGFFDKIGGFFRSLFGLTKTYEQ